MRRRDFLVTLPVLPPLRGARTSVRDEGKVITVLGPRAPSDLGTMLPHEHIMSTFGAEPADRPDYNTADLLRTVIPYLSSLKKQGCTAIADCTAAQFGRAPDLLRSISRKTGMHILTNTGYYGAAKDRYVPPHAVEETAGQLAARWLGEWQDGIDGTGVRPGFLKIGVDAGPLSPVDKKLVQAAARTHLGSGLAIAVHTGDNFEAAQEQLALLRAEGVSPEAWIWVHAHAATNEAILSCAERGAWISFDAISLSSLDRHLELVRMMKRAGRLAQVLLSHDGDLFPVPGGKPRPFEALFTHFIPKLRQEGFTQREIQALVAGNPQRAFTIRIRRLG